MVARRGVGVASVGKVWDGVQMSPPVNVDYPTPSSRTFRESLHDATSLLDILRRLRLEKRSGTLMINFSQGSPSGTLKWTEPVNR